MLFFIFAVGFNSRPSSSEGFFLGSGCEEHPQILTDWPAPPLQTSVISKLYFYFFSALGFISLYTTVYILPAVLTAVALVPVFLIL